MAENTDSKGPEEAAGTRRLPPMKTLLMLVGVFLGEAIAIGGMFFILAPDPAQADDQAAVEAAAGERAVEIPVVNDKFANRRTGRTFLYETEVVIRTRQKHKNVVEEKLEERVAQIRAAVSFIFRSAEPVHLHETTLATIKRQIQSMLDEHLGPSEEDESFVDEVIIPRCTEYRADI